MSDRIVRILATGLGLGLSPFAPGTFGSVGGVALAWGLQQLPIPLHWLLAALLIAVGIPICGRAAALYGKQDPGQVVFDEIAAIPILFLWIPVRLETAILGFLWFRVFDIWKPWPVCTLEKIPGGLGVMADDLGAAVFSLAALWLTLKLCGW